VDAILLTTHKGFMFALCLLQSFQLMKLEEFVNDSLAKFEIVGTKVILILEKQRVNLQLPKKH
jgi:hypothetical protein